MKVLTMMEQERNNRPWGYYQVFDTGKNFQVKKLVINPGQQTSLQFHLNRDEYWIVVQGTGRYILDSTIHNLCPGISAFIPRGSLHRIIGNQEEPLIIIEVWVGDLLSEEDIIRIEDDYGR